MIIRNESITDYHSSGAFGKSSLMDLSKHGPAHFHAAHIARSMIRGDTPALRFGRIFDALMEDEEKARANWAPPIPEDAPSRPQERHRDAKKPSPATLAAFDYWDEWDVVNAGKESVNDEERERLAHMLAACKENAPAWSLWQGCERQVSIRRELDGLGISLQSRPDGLDLARNMLVDVKTCRDITRFPLDCLTYGYHIQLALGQWLLAKEVHQVDAVLIAVESKLHPRAKAFRLPEVALAAGWEKCKALADEVARRIKDNDWIDHQAEVETIALPDWTIRRLEEEAV